MIERAPPKVKVFGPNNPKQRAYVETWADEGLIVGGKKAGKTFINPILCCRYIQDPRFVALFLRRHTPDLEYMWHVGKKIYRAACDGVHFNDTRKIVTFPHPDKDIEGARIYYSFAERESDLENYQGWGIPAIFFDEITQWESPDVYATLLGENYAAIDEETGKPWMRAIMRATTNPFGPGAQWVHDWFGFDRHDNAAFDQGVTFRDEASGLWRFAVRTTAYDNPDIDADDYIRRLGVLTERKRKAFIYAQWVFDHGGALEEWDEDQHIVPPFRIPRHYPIIISGDYGFSTIAAYHAHAVNPQDGAVVTFKEWTFTRTKARDQAVRMREDLEELGIDLDRIEDAPLGADAWQDEERGTSPALDMIDEGLPWREATFRRESGYTAVVELMTTTIPRETGPVRAWRVMRGTCPMLVKTITQLPGKVGLDDVDKDKARKANGGKGIDHWYDSCFIGDTIVDTATGPTSIQSLVGSEPILFSPSGAPIAAGHVRMTRRNAPTVVVALADGRSIRCTPDHRFAAERGWIRADALLGEYVLDASDTIAHAARHESSRYQRDDPGFQRPEVLQVRPVFPTANRKDDAAPASRRLGTRAWSGPAWIGRPPPKPRQGGQSAGEPGTYESRGARADAQRRRRRGSEKAVHRARDTGGESMARHSGGTRVACGEREAGAGEARAAVVHVRDVPRAVSVEANSSPSLLLGEVPAADANVPGERLDIGPSANAVRVVSVEQAEPADVYCLTSEIGCFTICGGLVVANCKNMAMSPLMEQVRTSGRGEQDALERAYEPRNLDDYEPASLDTPQGW